MRKYCPLCDDITNCTENCTQCLKEEREKEKMDELVARIKAEQTAYHDYLATLQPQDIIAKSYETCWRAEFAILLENTMFDEKTVEALLKLQHILDVLYDEWLHTDDRISEKLEDVIYFFAKEKQS